jgi:alpha-tubulin suppressor-like RCC1 family protein
MGNPSAMSRTASVAPSAIPEDRKELEIDQATMIDEKAFIFACGKNAEGDLGLGNSDGKVNLPKNVAQLNDFPVKQIAGSNAHSVLMTPSGEVHVSGSTLHGKLGLEGIEKQSLNKFHVIT